MDRPVIEFDEASHIYRVGGKIIPSVTQVLPTRDFHCTPEQLESASIEGSWNHQLLDMVMGDGSAPGFIDSKDEQKIQAIRDFIVRDNPGRVVLSEPPDGLYSARHRFAGKPDTVFETAILDMKRTIGDARYHALQLAGYHILALENGIIEKPTKRWYILTVDEGGKYRVVNVWNPLAESVFLDLVRVAHVSANYERYMKTVA
jgi:hypothetical protein